VTQATPELLDLAANILNPKEGDTLVLQTSPFSNKTA
jgi:hypothetical protein